LAHADNVVCIKGMIKLVLYDPRKKSSTYKEVNQFLIGIHNPMLVQIPAGVYHGWMCVSVEEAIIINIPTEAYDYEKPDELRLDPHKNDIPYDWRRKDG
jgi:dTDP-4-dehydrorhamnose 3,5-epimerase